MNTVRFDPEARKEFLDAILYDERCQAGLGARFRVAIESATNQISNSPFVYRILQAPFRCYLIPKFPYYLIYSIEPDHIRVVAVAHNKRKPAYWTKRSTKRVND